jgi:hypothetical protein
MPRTAIAAAIVLRAALIVLIAALGAPHAFVVSDSDSYLLLARRLAATGRFIDGFATPELFRTPVYPLLLVPGMLLRHPIVFALGMNVLFAAAVVVVTYRIAQRVLRDDRAAALCALLVAVEPTMLTYSLKVMPETLFTLCLLLFAYAALLDRPVAAGIALCAAAYVKPIAWPLVFVILAGALLARRRRALPLVATCLLLLAPWHLRNYLETGYAGFSTLIERSLFLSAGGSVVARQEHRPYEEVRRQLIARDDLKGPAAADPARAARMRREGISNVASDPLGWAKTHVAGMLRTLFDPGAVEYLRMFGLYSQGGRAVIGSGGVFAVARAYPLPFLLSALLGVLLLPLVILPFVASTRIPRHARFAFGLFALLAAYLVTAGGGMPGYHRMRVPAVPFLVLMSAFVYTARTCSSPRSPSAPSPQPSPSSPPT